MSNTSRIMYLPRAESYVKKAVHNHKLEIAKTGHDGDMATLDFTIPRNFDIENFYHDLRAGNKDVR